MKKLVLLALPLAACAHLPPAPPPAPGPNIDLDLIDRRVPPCKDFYAFACNGWIAKTNIPPDRALWTRSFSEIDERNQALLRETLKADAAGKGDARDPDVKKLGDYWTSCMDEARIEETARADLAAQLARVGEVKDIATLAKVLALLQGEGVDAFFDFGSGQDFKDATEVIGQLDQGGLGLPDRDYYLKDDAKTRAIRAAYQEHVARMLRLCGSCAERPEEAAADIVALERKLALVSLSRVARRNPDNVYHRIDLAGLEKTAPAFPWADWLARLGHPRITAINVAVPGFFAGLDRILRETPPKVLAEYLRWHLVDSLVPALPAEFVREDFRYKSENFTGARRILPRWKRCMASVDEALGQALGRAFVKETYGAAGKARNVARVKAIEAAMGEDLARVGWMDEPTRAKAEEKLGLVGNQIGYPDKWRDYGKLAIDRTSFMDNLLRARAFEVQRDLDKIGKPVDRSDWDMTPQQVNAYYDATLNEMVFPAGIQQPPFFDLDSGAAANYGGIGMVMGHELTHGFDDEGRRFDGHGNLRDWWTQGSAQAFQRRTECVARQYEGYAPLAGLHINGKLTLGENIADLGGVKLAYTAFEKEQAGRAVPALGGFTPEQQFFLAYAQAWCGKLRDPYLRLMLVTNPHSPFRYRVLGPLSNFAPFAKAFSCREGDPMVRPAKDRCEVW